MLRKRSRSIQKDQEHTGQMASSDTNHESYSQSHVLGSNAKSNSIFNAPLLFVGMGPKGLLDSDSVKSPTSPLDFSFLSNLSNPFRTPSSLSNEGQQRSWDCAKVGLSIIDSLEECSKFSGKILQASESKKTSLRPQMITKSPSCKSYVDSPMASKSLPKDFCKIPCAQNGSFLHKDESSVLFEIGETLLENESFCKTVSSSLDSYKLNTNRVAAASSDEFMNSLSASEIELSEDYTCVISHGPNPKTTHIFCDCILETHANDFKSNCKKEEEGKGLPIFNLNMLNTHNQYPSDDFLSFCYHCSKKLEEGKDIYIYRGEKSFCSVSCREIEMMIDEELESFNSSVENSPKWKFGGELFET
uniref:FLZ-type domain-containing protein n=1 Tax=Cajanus cajan TaxID=3821 RepID=A0A151RD18_CAJCA|nr:hypothetical protein KK1_038109 [Cajanus cajan]